MVQKFFLFSLFLFLISYSSIAQPDSCHLRISLLTASPGEELYSTFGHSALRITDSLNNDDVVYNYGTFNFDEPGFYLKFIQGKLMYYLSTEDFNSFKQSYQQENRSLIEQVLNLSCTEKQKLLQLLQLNLQGENKFYKYDFLFDNCTTRLRDLLEKTADSSVYFTTILKTNTSFRELIHEYLNYNDKEWSKLGIDLLLGSKTDAIMNKREIMFLPDYLLKGFDSATISGKPVVAFKNNVYNLQPKKVEKNFLLSPVFIFSLLLVAIVLLSFSKNDGIKKFLFGFDGFLFFITGFAGLLILVMWFFTEHLLTKDNYNIIWAWPTHLIMAFFIHSKKNWVKKYFWTVAIFNMLVLIVWFFLPQQLNPAFIPFVLLLIVRSIFYAKQQINTI